MKRGCNSDLTILKSSNLINKFGKISADENFKSIIQPILDETLKECTKKKKCGQYKDNTLLFGEASLRSYHNGKILFKTTILGAPDEFEKYIDFQKHAESCFKECLENSLRKQNIDSKDLYSLWVYYNIPQDYYQRFTSEFCEKIGYKKFETQEIVIGPKKHFKIFYSHHTTCIITTLSRSDSIDVLGDIIFDITEGIDDKSFSKKDEKLLQEISDKISANFSDGLIVNKVYRRSHKKIEVLTALALCFIGILISTSAIVKIGSNLLMGLGGFSVIVSVVFFLLAYIKTIHQDFIF